MSHLSKQLMIPDAILQDIFEKRCSFERVDLLIRAALTRGEDDNGLGTTTSICWQAEEATQVDLTIRRANACERYTDIIVESWTPIPPPKPCKVEKKLIFEREKDYHEPYMEWVFEVEEHPKKIIKEFKYLFDKPTYYDEPYVEELWDIIPTSTGEAPELGASVSVDNNIGIGIQTEIALGEKLTAESIASVDETSATVNENGDEEIITTMPQEQEEEEEQEGNTEVSENETAVHEILKGTFVDPSVDTFGLNSAEREEQKQSLKMSSPVGHTVLLFTESRIYYEPYMRRLAAEDVRLDMLTWDDKTLPDIPEEVSLPMWDRYLMITQDAIPQQFDENWEWLVKNNESLFLGKDYEIALGQYFLDPSGDFGFLSGPVPEIRSLSSAIAQRCPEIMDLLHKLGPAKSRQWLSSLEKELSSQHDDVSVVDVEGLLTEVFPEVEESTAAVHLPEQSANGKILILQFGNMKVVMTCKENASSNSFSITTNLTFNFSKLTQNSKVRHRVMTDVQKAGLRTVIGLRCKEIFILSVGTDSIVNKGLYLDPRETPRKIVSYQLLKNEEVREESRKLLVQGGTPFIITIPDGYEDVLKQSWDEASVQTTPDEGTFIDVGVEDTGLCENQAETTSMNVIEQTEGKQSAELPVEAKISSSVMAETVTVPLREIPDEIGQESETGESRKEGKQTAANRQTKTDDRRTGHVNKITTHTVLSEEDMEAIYYRAGQLDPRFPQASGAGSRTPDRVPRSSDKEKTSTQRNSHHRQDFALVSGRELAPVLSMLKRIQRDARALESCKSRQSDISRSGSSGRPAGARKETTSRHVSCVRMEVQSRSPSGRKVSSAASVMSDEQCSLQSEENSTSSNTSVYNLSTSNK